MRRKREADSNVGLGHESRRRCGAVIESGYSQEGTFQRLKTAPYLFRLYEQDSISAVNRWISGTASLMQATPSPQTAVVAMMIQATIGGLE